MIVYRGRKGISYLPLFFCFAKKMMKLLRYAVQVGFLSPSSLSLSLFPSHRMFIFTARVRSILICMYEIPLPPPFFTVVQPRYARGECMSCFISLYSLYSFFLAFLSPHSLFNNFFDVKL